MDSHFDLDDAEFEKQLEDCSLDPMIFDHEGHLRMAYIQINKYGIDYACDNMCRQIQDFDATYGTGRIFHTTLTYCSIQIVNQFMNRTKTKSFKQFLSLYPILKKDFKSLVNNYYTDSLLRKDIARLVYIPPDINDF